MKLKHSFSNYQKKLEQDILTGLYCYKCKNTTFPPMSVCSNCGSPKNEIIELEKKGFIRTFTVIRVAPKGWIAPYIVGMVEMSSGPWVTGNIIDINPDKADMNLIGKKVEISNQIVKGDEYSKDEIRSLTFKLIE